ncbi:Subtilisin-like serine protease [Fulvivirga imtechensis AK7]|uniref:Subtilisin-like serine protease n=1 Tax=Fulvivirga imtechensis AK7 TaxID=1237149 RepID=L8JZD9_9BACT|nr:S8 family serine peptidase [Fulvivirga imtechensis]ELR72562.1 Subtilisin-like serine protease [Fulvivirga imtechensis AK7]
MKNHLIIWTAPDKRLDELPYWGDLIHKRDEEAAASRFLPEVSTLFNQYNLPVLYTKEYKPKNDIWSAEEVKSGLANIFRIILKQDKKIPDALIEKIKLVPYIRKVKPVDVGVAALPPIASPMSVAALDPSSQILLKQAHAYTTGSPEIKIAVLDTGVDKKHQEIGESLLPGMDFVDIIDGAEKFVGDYLGYDTDPDDEVGHGTHVCGILAAKGIKMPTGIAPSCKIVPVRVLGALKTGNGVVGAGLIDNINNGIKWAVDQQVDVINMSLGIRHEGGGLPHEEVIRYALSKGVSIVAASGNDGRQDRYYPGALPGVIAVGAVDHNNQMATFSTYGSHVSFVAPGANIISTYPENKYSISSGTSQASPYVAGAIALLKAFALKFGRNLKDNQAKYILKHTADRLDSTLKNVKSGYGLINLLDALKLLKYKLSV